MQIDLSRFRETFFQEAAENLADMEQALLSLEQAAGDAELLNRIFRSAHSLKGASGTFGLDDITRFTHQLESLLDRMRSGELVPEPQHAALLLRAVDVLKELLAAAQAGAGEAPSALFEQVLGELIVAQRSGPADPVKRLAIRSGDRAARRVHTAYRIAFRPAEDLFRRGMDPLFILRDLAENGTLSDVRADLTRLPPLAALEPDGCYLGWTMRLTTDRTPAEIRDLFAFVEDGSDISIEPENAASPGPEPAKPAGAAQPAARATLRESSIRVSTEKVDKLIDLVGELVIAHSMAAEIMHDFTPEKLFALQEAMGEMERYTRELQERVMGVRMLPVGNIFSRFPRLVRDTAAGLSKQVTLEMSGEETELDKGVVEKLSDPLTHLIRNAIDHGIEPPDERVRQGKLEQGVIRLKAFHQGGNVLIEVSDDGRGLDTARIREKGIERGLLDGSAEPGGEEIHALIFEPGFSTAAAVSDLSGRGVGMDVVRRNVESLNGAVSVSSRRGQGTTVRIKLPLTLAILDGLLLRVGEQTFIMPLVSIIESIRPKPNQVKTVTGKGEVVVVRKEPLPLLRLHALLSVPTTVVDPARGLVVVVEHEGRRLAVLVDELLGQQQVVIKSLETHFKKVDGIVGATILGDGHPALIVDVAGIVQMSRGGAVVAGDAPGAPQPAAA